ncbi:MAG: sulfatase [Acidobacteria bacterium]|nr:sulfatase [Acidobacteriota bacterium]
MTRRAFLASSAGTAFAQSGGRKPNFIVILADDLGYGDLGCYGSPNIRTPNLDRMARDGVRFTSFYAQPVCGPSRAALLTGCYPPRNSLAFNHLPGFVTGIHPDEVTIPEVLKQAGYATMMTGKWHLGDDPKFSPLRNGFDRYFGIPFSNDMWPYHPRMPFGQQPHPMLAAIRKRAGYTGYAGQGTEFPPGGGFPKALPLIEQEEVIEQNPDQSQLTGRFTDAALRFIESNRARPFFLYMAHVMPHVPLFASANFAGRSARGLYGDTVEELDASVGRILDRLAQLGLDQNTMVVFASDNGPWLQYGVDGGSAGPLRNGKGTQWEGGSRVPAIMRWPGRIPGGRVNGEIVTTMDLLPTFAEIAGARLPSGRVVDGKSQWPLLRRAPGAKSAQDTFYYFGADLFGEPGSTEPTPGYEIPKLQAIRVNEWKAHLNEKTLEPTALFHLGEDVGESHDRLKSNGGEAARLAAQARRFRDTLAAQVRPLGRR